MKYKFNSSIPFFLLLFGIVIIISGCKAPNFLIGQWKVVEMQAEGKVYGEGRLGDYLYEFKKNGKLMVTSDGQMEERKYIHEEGYLIDPDGGEEGKWKVDELTEAKLIMSGTHETGGPYKLVLKKL